MKMPGEDSGAFQWADYYLSFGLCVIPLKEGKHPSVRWSEFQTRLPTRKELGAWFIGKQPAWGMAIVCGEVSGNLVRLDFDDPKDYDKLWARIEEYVKQPMPVFKSQREGGGFGILLKSTSVVPILPQKTFPSFPKLEVRGQGSFTVVPPTPGYEWLLPLDSIPTLDVKKMMVDLFEWDEGKAKRLAEGLKASPMASDELSMLLRETGEGERNNNLVRIASMLRSRGIDSDTAVQIMQVNFEEHWPHDDMTWEEARETFIAAYNRYAHEGVKVGGSVVHMATLPKAAASPTAQRSHRVKFSQIKPGNDRVLIDRLVLAGNEGNTIIAAPTKMGKTSLLLDACISASKGEPVWGSLHVPRPLTIAFIDQELKYVQLKENQEKMVPVVGYPDEDRLQVLYNEDGQYQIGDQAGLNALYKDLEDMKPDLVVLDGWGWFVGHQASDPKMVMPAMTWWKQVRQTLGCATIIIHHYKKEQRTGRQEVTSWEDGDSLDMIEGLKRFSDQAQTVLGYTSIPHYDTFGLLKGRTNHTAWDPLRIVIDYDHTTLTHRVIDRAEGLELFDPDTARLIWEISADSRWLKGALNTICLRMGLTQADLAKHFNVNQGQISKWRSGLKNPSKEVEEQIKLMYDKAKYMPLKAKSMPKGERRD